MHQPRRSDGNIQMRCMRCLDLIGWQHQNPLQWKPYTRHGHRITCLVKDMFPLARRESKSLPFPQKRTPLAKRGLLRPHHQRVRRVRLQRRQPPPELRCPGREALLGLRVQGVFVGVRCWPFSWILSLSMDATTNETDFTDSKAPLRP